MAERYRILLSAAGVFLISIFPAILGLFSFYRYETLSILLRTRDLIPDLSVTSFVNMWQNNFYEYYRPGEYVIWGVSYLIAGNNPMFYQLFQAIIYALIAVGLYLAARYFAGEFAGWAAALIFAYLEASVVLSWWTATMDGFFGMLCFIAGLVIFLYMPFRTGISIVLSTLCVGLAIFTKETHILLWVVFPLFTLTMPTLRSRAHWIITGVTLGLIFLKLFLQSLAGAGPGDHIVASVFDIDPRLAMQNYIDYGRLLLYGHNILLIFLCLLRPESDTSPGRLTGLLAATLLLFITARVANMMWLLDAGILAGLAYYAWRAAWFERIWIVWTLAGLSLVILYDIRIVGGIMNRRILEPSMGFGLFAGCALACYPAYFKRQWEGLSLRVILNDIMDIRRIPQLIKRHAAAICLALLLLIGFRQQVQDSGIMREWRYWTSEGKLLWATLYTLNNTLPEEATLVADSVPGFQKPEQIQDAMAFMFNRYDIELLHSEDVMRERQRISAPSAAPLFTLTTEPTSGMSAAYSLSLINTFTDPDGLVKTIYLYRAYDRP